MGGMMGGDPEAVADTGIGPAAAPTGQPLVTDPFAGQGVHQPNVPGGPSGQRVGGGGAGGTLPPPLPPEQAGAATAASTTTGGTSSAAPAARPGGTATQTAPRSHTVAAGETAWSVARRYDVTIQALAQANNLDANMTVRAGQTLTIPAGGSSTTAAVTAPGQGSPTPEPPSAATALPDERTTPAAAPAPRPNAPNLGATRTAQSGSGRFRMPVPGAITRTYSKGSYDGIAISAPSGTSIAAAGAGEVAAITRDTNGTQIVVLRHSDGLLTVYAGLGQVSVAQGAQVSAGQSLGSAGGTGSLHFEVRRGYESVNPEDYLG
ncbi:MAG: M23 family metallopeptidase [Paracoccus sp. (in: a-proteobacteria)]|nr:M23 family metallopeptidase [Paracoccus sp. (in: a-proteobacteria)]